MSAVTTTVAVAPRSGLRQLVADYIALTKPRVISLLLVTALASMVVAQRGWPATDLVLAIMIGGYLAAGGANAINMWFDRDIDAEMYRTRLRPIPAGRVRPRSALWFGLVLNAIAFAVMAFRANLLAAFLTLGATAFYVLVYTMWLKRTTPQNIVIGGAAGAFPAADRVGGGHGQPRAAAAVHVRDRLLLDAAPLLGPGAAPRGRLRPGPRADAAPGAGTP